MFPNIRAELGRRKMTKRDLSAETGIKYGTLISKLNGESEYRGRRYKESSQNRNAARGSVRAGRAGR